MILSSKESMRRWTKKLSFKDGQFGIQGSQRDEWASQAALVAKNMPANARDSRDMDSIPGLGRFPWRRKTVTDFSILA